MGRIKQRVREVIGWRYSLSLKELIKELTPVIRGWKNYHKAGKSLCSSRFTSSMLLSPNGCGYS
ncbi:MAG: hypothetical protein JRH18_13340 [Deltaproteobacteria bacterium]|nr:hypothetical protein [Deltaproteobacteria bacterium]MBW2152640.1 hypothetical protein [Deltaproteobacteria bacterium]